jgi:outer membrane receptor protein involved in Fe transport
LTVSADYYSIRINDAIAAVQAQDIVNTCYDNTTFPNQFCNLFRRNGPTAGPATFGFNFLTQTQLNFGRIETSGIDASINYGFEISEFKVNVGVNGNWTEKVDRFFDPRDQTLVNPALRELSVPEFSGTANLNVKRGRLALGYNVQYIDSTAAAAAIQIERIATEFGDAGFAPTYFVHGLSFNVDIFKDSAIYGGVNNLTNAQPYISSSAYPVSGLGRLFFVGVRTKL